MSKSCIIIGSGIVGPAAALSLSRIGIKCTIYELRNVPSTIGGAVQLTPVAIKLLSDLGVTLSGCPVRSFEFFSLHTASKLGQFKFGEEPSHGMRILRSDLQQALLTAIEKAGIKVVYDSRLVSVEDDSSKDKITAVFANGSSVSGDFIIGCDGVRSAVRTAYVEPGRIALYSGAAGAYSIVDKGALTVPVHFQDSGLNLSRHGTVLTSFVDPERTKIYIAAVMQVEEQESKMEWRARGSDHDAIVKEIHRRYDDSAIPCLPQMVNQLKDLFLFPVFQLGPGGKWTRGRAVLLGDAAHAMPPQGEAVGLALEDATLLTRVFQELPEKSIPEAFAIYEKTRKPRVDVVYTEANKRWEKVMDRGWLKQKALEMMFRVILYIKGGGAPEYDIRKEKLAQDI